MIERFENGELIPEQEWIDYINDLEIASKPSTKDEVKKAFVYAVRKRIPKEKFGVFLSGGVDSSLIALVCKQAGADFICYTAGLEQAQDLEWAEKMAGFLDVTLRKKVFTLEESEDLIVRTAKCFDKPSVLRVGVGSVILACSEMAKEDGITIFVGGLGSEEIFAGYKRHFDAKDRHKECWEGLKTMWDRDFTRDHQVAKALGIKVLVPFLDGELIVKAMGIPVEKKIDEEQKKIILREIAEELGLPKEFAWRPKKAAQYGSKFDKAMKRLAKRKGLYKVEWLKSLENEAN